MEQLSREAQETLDEFRELRLSGSADEQGARQRFVRGLREEQAQQMATSQSRRRKMRIRRIWWRRMRPALLGLSIAVVWVAVNRHTNHTGETALLNDARTHLEREEFASAYRRLVEHSRLYETRPAAERRMGMVVDALCGMGKRDRARRQLEAYLELDPDSIHAGRGQLCPGDPPPGPEPAVDAQITHVGPSVIEVDQPAGDESAPATDKPQPDPTADIEVRSGDMVVTPKQGDTGSPGWSSLNPSHGFEGIK